MNIRARFKDINIGTDLKPELIISTNRIGENIEKLKDKELEIELKEIKDKQLIY